MKSFEQVLDDAAGKSAEFSFSRQGFPPALTGLYPAFRDTRTGETHLAATAAGIPSMVHEFHHLPVDWIVERDANGEPIALHAAIVAGYHRFDRFLPLDILSAPLQDA